MKCWVPFWIQSDSKEPLWCLFGLSFRYGLSLVAVSIHKSFKFLNRVGYQISKSLALSLYG